MIKAVGEIVIYKTGINLYHFFLEMFLAYILLGILRIFVGSELIMDSIYIVLGVAFYFLLSELVNICFILDDSIVIVYYFRLRNNKVRIAHDNITLIKFFNQSARFSYSYIQCEISHKKVKLDMPSNSFPIHSFKKRRTKLRFFENKGIPIEIISDSEKDWTILEK
ncbi:MAG: hypothetical protein AB9834_06690 [Lentimicrobium sp.]